MLTINVSEVVLTVINFFLLYFLLKRFLYTPLIRFMDERETRIDAGEAVRKKALDDARESKAHMDEELRKSREEALRIANDVRLSGDAAHAELVRRLHESRRRATQESRERIEALRREESAELDARREALTGLLVSRLLSEAGRR